jgi:hypothetical protein
LLSLLSNGPVFTLRPAYAADVISYSLLKGKQYVHTNSASPPAAATNAFAFEAAATAQNSSSLNSATITTPGSSGVGLSKDDTGTNFVTQQSFATQTALDTTFSTGSDTCGFWGAVDDEVTFPMVLASGSNPPPPQIANVEVASAHCSAGCEWNTGSKSPATRVSLWSNWIPTPGYAAKG